MAICCFFITYMNPKPQTIDDVLRAFDEQYPDYSDLPEKIYKPEPGEIVIRQNIKVFIKHAYKEGAKAAIEATRLEKIKYDGMSTTIAVGADAVNEFIENQSQKAQAFLEGLEGE